MTIIKTREDLREYIKYQLGYPLVQVELTDEHLDLAIDNAIKYFAHNSHDGLPHKFIKFECNGMGDYQVGPEVIEIVSVEQSGLWSLGGDLNGMVDQNLSNYILSSSGVALSYLVTLSSSRALVDKYFASKIAFEYNSNTRKLTILQNFRGPLLVEAYLEYIPEEFDMIYNHEWVKAYAVALSRIQQSVIVGKYSANLVGGSQINYTDIAQRGSEEKQQLEEDLDNRYIEPACFIVA